MRQDQYDRLLVRIDQLTEAFLEEADPVAWPGAGVPIANMDRESRGDRYWCKKNAAATIALVHRMHGLVGIVQGVELPDPAPSAEQDDGDLEAEIAASEREAEKLLSKIRKR